MPSVIQLFLKPDTQNPTAHKNHPPPANQYSALTNSIGTASNSIKIRT